MIWFARWNGWTTPHEDNGDMIGNYMDSHRERERVFQEQIAALGGRVPRSSRMQPRTSRPSHHHGRVGARGEMRIFMPESARGPPVIVRGRNGWTLGSKLIAVGAGVVLVVGVALTLMTVNSKLAMDTYRPFIYTIFGVLFIIVAPMVACRMVLNAYDRRLLREQRQFESLARRIRRQGHDADTASRLPTSITSRAQLAAEFFFGPSRASVQIQSGCSNREASECFPDTLPSYNSALDLTDNEHWMKKFFRDSPPTYEEAVIEMRTMRPMSVVGRRRSLSLSDIRADAVSSTSHSASAEQDEGPPLTEPADVVADEANNAVLTTGTDEQQLLSNESSAHDQG